MISRLLGRPTDGPADTVRAPIADATTQVGLGWTTKLFSAGLFVCIALGPVGAFLGAAAYNQASQPTASAPVVGEELSDERAVAGEYAQRVVTAWLTATQDDVGELPALVPGVSTGPLAREAFGVSDLAVAGIEKADGAWAVTVAATVADAREATARRYFRVPVRVTGDVVTALMSPTPVSGPVASADASNGYRARVDVSSPVGQAVTGFLGAYLAGASDVSRWTTPGAVLAALEPAPYTALSLDGLRSVQGLDADATPADGQTIRLLAEATATVTDDQTVPVAMAMTMTARAGRWETTAIDLAPAQGATPDATPSSAAPTGTAVTP
jgi:hypothetical protein